jgi:aminoglycoside 6-adenylyltransferase
MSAVVQEQYGQLEQRFVAWAQSRSDIRSAIVIGSRARTNPPPDDWSDLDIILYAVDPQVYAQNAGWLSKLGAVWLTVLNETFAREKEWLVLFEGGLKVDFVLSKATGPIQTMLEQSPYRLVLRRGVRLLFDKESGVADLTIPKSWQRPPRPPTRGEFLAAVNDFLLRATRTARLLKRGEPWQAIEQCNGRLKQCLLTMMMWHARVTKGAKPDTWYEGRYLDQWADPLILDAVPATFAAYDIEDLWRALFASLALFRHLATETADRLGYPYPTAVDHQISQWLVDQHRR